MRSGFAVVLSPFDTAARAVSRPVLNAWHGITGYDELLRENERLRERIAQQRGATIEAQAAILEYQELLQLNRLIGLSGYPKVVAQVQGESPSNFRYTVEISIGSNDGIAVGMPVVNGAGLVGKITMAPNSSIVLLITDPEFSIGAKILVERVAETGAARRCRGGDAAGGLVDPTPTTCRPTPTPADHHDDHPRTTTSTTPPRTGHVNRPADSESPDDTGPGDLRRPARSTSSRTTPRPAAADPRDGTLRGQGPGRR
jgi:rod shape-determining protein MreC